MAESRPEPAGSRPSLDDEIICGGAGQVWSKLTEVHSGSGRCRGPHKRVKERVLRSGGSTLWRRCGPTAGRRLVRYTPVAGAGPVHAAVVGRANVDRSLPRLIRATRPGRRVGVSPARDRGGLPTNPGRVLPPRPNSCIGPPDRFNKKCSIRSAPPGPDPAAPSTRSLHRFQAGEVPDLQDATPAVPRSRHMRRPGRARCVAGAGAHAPQPGPDAEAATPAIREQAAGHERKKILPPGTIAFLRRI